MLTVIDNDVNKGCGGQTLIRCKCRCGNEVVITKSQWNQGRRKSCGCMKQQRIRSYEPIPLGKQGHLTIIESGLSKPTGRRYARCICDCNPNVIIERNECDLRKGLKSCGCEGRVPIGSVFGRLTVIDNDITDNGEAMVRVRCSCDKHTEFVVRQTSLKRGNTQSCGCLLVDAHITHGDSNTRLYHIWKGIKDRCDNDGRHYSKFYKDKGISYTQDWLDFCVFREWAMSHGYREDLTIDRIDNTKGYTPDNCRWVNRQVQSENRTCVRNISFDGEVHTISEWSRRIGTEFSTLDKRINKGWTTKEALTAPIGVKRGWRKKIDKDMCCHHLMY